jgi:hypothetical protein
MRLAARFGFIIIAAACVSVPVQARSPDDNLKVYAVNVVKTPPWEKQFTGYGITAAVLPRNSPPSAAATLRAIARLRASLTATTASTMRSGAS